jgi:hypothetical protein
VLLCFGCRCVLPIGALFAVVLWTGNAAFLYLSVSFVQMMKVRISSHYHMFRVCRNRSSVASTAAARCTVCSMKGTHICTHSGPRKLCHSIILRIAFVPSLRGHVCHVL